MSYNWELNKPYPTADGNRTAFLLQRVVVEYGPTFYIGYCRHCENGYPYAERWVEMADGSLSANHASGDIRIPPAPKTYRYRREFVHACGSWLTTDAPEGIYRHLLSPKNYVGHLLETTQGDKVTYEFFPKAEK